MKIAITSKGRNLDADVDPRFGRAAYILISDTDTLEVEAIDNAQNANSFKGTGIHAAAFISEKMPKFSSQDFVALMLLKHWRLPVSK